MDDARLLADFARDRSEEAFQELVSRHVGMVYSVCRRQLGDAHWAEDVTQAVFILLARKAAGLPSNVILGGWLYKTAVFACSNARGLKRTRTYHENRVTPMKVRNDQEDLERAEIEGLLDEGLMQLTKAQREVLVLRFFEKKPVADVARMRKESIYMTQKTLDQGLARLRRFLAQRGVAATAAILVALLIEESARAVPAGLAAAAGSAALGTSKALSTYASQLATQLIRRAGRAKLLASLTAVGMLLAFALTVFGIRTAPKQRFAPAAPTVTTVITSNPSETDEIAALWRTLSRAEQALRKMDAPELSQVVAFTNPQQADNWRVMAGVFAADQRLKQVAGQKFGPAGLTLTTVQTFAQRLDEILPQINLETIVWTVHPNDAALHFNYLNPATPGGSVLFLKIDGQWQIDASKSVDVTLEGLNSSMLRVAVQQLDENGRLGVMDKMVQMEMILSTVTRRIETDPYYDIAAAREDLQKIDSNTGSRAFFHLALRLDSRQSPRE